VRKIERLMTRAIFDGRSWRQGNTEVRWSRFPHQTYGQVLLHGNKIAEVWTTKSGEWRLSISDAGWQTVTTKSRLNALIGELVNPRLRISQSDWEWSLIGTDGTATPWLGDWTFDAALLRSGVMLEVV
jgi:hypothetical protein